MIPEHYKEFCNKEAIEYCEYFMHKDCPETCGYARDILGTIDRITIKKGLDKLFEEDMKDF